MSRQSGSRAGDYTDFPFPLILLSEVVLSALASDVAIVDGVEWTMMITGEAHRATAVVIPYRWRSFDVLYRTNLGTQAATRTAIRVYREFAVGYHLPVEIAANDVRIESGSGALL